MGCVGVRRGGCASGGCNPPRWFCLTKNQVCVNDSRRWHLHADVLTGKVNSVLFSAAVTALSSRKNVTPTTAALMLVRISERADSDEWQPTGCRDGNLSKVLQAAALVPTGEAPAPLTLPMPGNACRTVNITIDDSCGVGSSLLLYCVDACFR